MVRFQWENLGNEVGIRDDDWWNLGFFFIWMMMAHYVFDCMKK